MCGTRFFIFGGQVDGEFMNDLWAFDLSSREFAEDSFFEYSHIRLTDTSFFSVKTPDPNWELYSPAPGSDLPAKRTGHVCVTHNDKIYLYVFITEILFHPLAKTNVTRPSALAGQMVSITTMTRGRSMSLPGHGGNYHVLDSFQCHEKGTLPRWSMMSCTFLGVVALMGRIWVT